jgi:hypothetical protein
VAWAYLYAVITALVLALALASGRSVLVGLVLLLALELGSTTLAVAVLGYQRAPNVMALSDAVIGLMIAMAARAWHSETAAWLLVLFIVGAAWHVTAFLAHTQGTRHYFEVLNGIYIAAIVLTGGVGIRGLVHRVAWGIDRAGAGPSRGLGTDSIGKESAEGDG